MAASGEVRTAKSRAGAAPSDGTRRRESAEPSGRSNLSNSLALSGTAALPRRYGVQHSKGGRAGGDGGGDTGSLENEPA